MIVVPKLVFYNYFLPRVFVTRVFVAGNLNEPAGRKLGSLGLSDQGSNSVTAQVVVEYT